MDNIDVELSGILGDLPATADAPLAESPVAALFRPSIPLDPDEAATLDSNFRKAVETTRQRAFSPEARREAILQKNFGGDAPTRPELLGGDSEQEFDLAEVDGSKSRWKAIYKNGQLVDCKFVRDIAA